MNGGEVGFTTGTTDPVYKYTVYTKQLPVTEPSSWPTSIDVRVTQQNARGGFIKETTTVFPPSYN